MIKTVIFGICAATMASGAMAQAPAAPAEGRTGSANPERQICRTVRDTGSRLSGYRTCKTASEWADQRRQLREGVDRVQSLRAPGNPLG